MEIFLHFQKKNSYALKTLDAVIISDITSMCLDRLNGNFYFKFNSELSDKRAELESEQIWLFENFWDFEEH